MVSGATYLLQFSKAGSKAARVRPVEGTLEVLWGLAVQGFSSSEGNDSGKCICGQESRSHMYVLTAPNHKTLPAKQMLTGEGQGIRAKLEGVEAKAVGRSWMDWNKKLCGLV